MFPLNQLMTGTFIISLAALHTIVQKNTAVTLNEKKIVWKYYWACPVPGILLVGW